MSELSVFERPTVWLTGAEPQAKRPVEPVLGGEIGINYLFTFFRQLSRLAKAIRLKTPILGSDINLFKAVSDS